MRGMHGLPDSVGPAGVRGSVGSGRRAVDPLQCTCMQCTWLDVPPADTFYTLREYDTENRVVYNSCAVRVTGAVSDPRV